MNANDLMLLKTIHTKRGWTGQMARLMRQGLIEQVKSKPTAIGGVVGVYALTDAGRSALAAA
jgi:hypothetical protein